MIKFLKGAAGIGLAYAAGSQADHFTEAQEQELIDSGYAERVEPIESKVNAENAAKKGKKNAENAVK